MDALPLAQALIRRPSITPSDAGALDVLEAVLKELGFVTHRLPFGDIDNLYARLGTTAPHFCFAGHTDVVPPGPVEEWLSDPFVPAIRDGILYGRGAADMKSGLAAMVTATESFVAANPTHRGSIAFLITSDEEGPSIDGTRRVVEKLRARSEQVDWCLVGEPSSEVTVGDTIKVGRRGSLSARLTVHGVQGHVAYPHLAANPVHALAPALAELARRVWDGGTEHFEPTSFQVSNINAGTGAPNVIPGELTARFNLRYSPVQTLQGLRRTVEEILHRHGVRCSLEWYVSGEPFYTPPGWLSRTVGDAVAEVTGVQPKLSTGGGTSDGRFIAALGAQVVELGAVNVSIHKVNECVRVADLAALDRMYFNVLRNLLA
ncbi:MAG: succinyl-diaminopimelate desuccinylase [Gammaproteobacteria bacterium]|nr:succinyl-diaminopimelate desuccinylase [Gammaproteobacteria bacterium]